MAATAALEAHRLDSGRPGSLALAARALEGAKRAQAALARRPGGAADTKLITYLHLKARILPLSVVQALHTLAGVKADWNACSSSGFHFV